MKLGVAFSLVLFQPEASSLRFPVTVICAFSFCDGLIHIGAENVAHCVPNDQDVARCCMSDSMVLNKAIECGERSTMLIERDYGCQVDRGNV